MRRTLLVATPLLFLTACAALDPASAPIAPTTAIASAPSVEARLAVAGFDDPAAFRRLYLELQAGFRSGDRAAVARLASCVVVNDSRGQWSVAGGPALVQRFDQAFPSSVRRAVLAQAYEELFANWQGAMVGRGDLWLTPLDGGGLVFTVNPGAPRCGSVEGLTR